jgi:hypothetical protein
MDRQHPLIGIQRSYRRRWLALGLALLLAAPVIARETIVLQKSGTDSQARGADATLIQATPNSNSVGNTLTVASATGANERAIVEFDLSRIPNVGIKQALLTLHVTTPPPVSAGTLTYQAYDVTNFWQSDVVSWNTRVATTAWTAAGGDIARHGHGNGHGHERQHDRPIQYHDRCTKLVQRQHKLRNDN